MTDRAPHGFFLSTTLHALIIAAVWLAYSFKTPPEPVKIFDLVAGAGDNFIATAAPALGSSESVKLDVPAPAPRPPAPSPIVEPAPISAAPPVEKAVPKETPPPKPVEKAVQPKKEKSIATQLRHSLWRAESNAKAEVKKQREAELKKEREREAEQKRMTKAEFDALHKAKQNPPKQPAKAPPKVAKIDPKGIVAGVVGGSPANITGGAGGNALTAEEGNEIERYVAMLQHRLKEQLDATPGLEDGLRAEAELHIMPDGQLMRAKIVKSSRNEAFDQAVLRAIRAVRMPPRPKGLEQIQTIPFATRAKE